MRGKRSRKRPWGESRPLQMSALASVARSEIGPDGESYQVQYLRSSSKPYTCPACLQTIAIGSAHVVAWPEERAYGLDQGVRARRHWHLNCWKRGLRPA